MHHIFAMAVYALTMSITPGPVNLICLSSGVNYGFKPTFGFVSGATIGFILLLLTVGISIGKIVAVNHLILITLSCIGSLFIAYLGYKILSSRPDIELTSTSKPTFTQGFLLQWLNPKAWMASVAGISAFHLIGHYRALAIFISIYFLICYASIAIWAWGGESASAILKNPNNLRRLNVVTGSALIGIAIYLIVTMPISQYL